MYTLQPSLGPADYGNDSNLQVSFCVGLRVDGRRPSELRKVQCKLGVFNQADGSAFLEQGNTQILATVYGPHDVRVFLCVFLWCAGIVVSLSQVLN